VCWTMARQWTTRGSLSSMGRFRLVRATTAKHSSHCCMQSTAYALSNSIFIGCILLPGSSYRTPESCEGSHHEKMQSRAENKGGDGRKLKIASILQPTARTAKLSDTLGKRCLVQTLQSPGDLSMDPRLDRAARAHKETP